MHTLDSLLIYLQQSGIRYIAPNDKDLSFHTYCPLKEPKPHAITWCKNEEFLDSIIPEAYPGLIVLADLDIYQEGRSDILWVEHVKETYFRVVDHYFRSQDPNYPKPRIEDSAVVKTDKIGQEVYIGHHTFIDEDVIIGDHVTIMHSVTIQGKVSIGDHCFIESGAVIGGCGFGTYLDSQGHPQLVSHLAGVRLGNHVKIFANTCITRGCLIDTVIEDYAMVDNLCHIAHNVHIAENTQIAACSEVSGSASIGKNTWIAPGVCVMNGIEVGDNVLAGMAANIVREVPDNVVVYGNPAKIKEEKKK